MVTVFLLGGDDQNNFGLKLCRALRSHGGAFYFCDRLAASYAVGEPEFLLLEATGLRILSADRCILLQKPDCVPVLFPETDRNPILIADIQSELSEGRRFPVLTAGAATGNCITVSGICEEEASISVQRPVETLRSNLILPCEIHVKLNTPMDRNVLLYACTLLILNGELGNDHLDIRFD